MKLFIVIIFYLVFSFTIADGFAYDSRYLQEGETVLRDVNGKIKRSSATVRQFKNLHPCVLPCRFDWQVDHIIPLACGGLDVVFNMQWLSPESKKLKDSFERKIYKAPYVIYGTGGCK
jgi:hypothetical protein